MSDSPTRATRIRKALLPPVSSAFRAAAFSPNAAINRTKGLFTRAFSADAPDPRITAAEDGQSKFKVALFISGSNERDLPSIERHAGRVFEAYAIMTIAAVLWMLVAPAMGFGGQSNWRLLNLFFPLAFVFLLGTKAFSASVTYYRIQRRSIVPVREFLNDPSAWLGGKPRLGTLITALALGTSLGWFLPAPAMAADITMATIQSTGAALNTLTTSVGAEDLSLEWLRRLFPAMANMACPTGSTSTISCTASDVGADVLAAMMGTMNAILMGIGSMILAWHTLSGTVSAAYEGKVMGQKFHLTWAPMRIMMGYGLLVPIKGYCGAQFAVLMVIVMGYNMANGLWSTYVNTALSGQLASVATSQAPNMGSDLANGILSSETCVAVLDGWRTGVQSQAGALGQLRISLGIYNTGVPATNVPNPAGDVGPVNSSLSPNKTWNYGAACGNVVTNSVDNSSSGVASALGGASNATVGALGSGVNTRANSDYSNQANQAYQAFTAARDTAVTKLINAVRQTGLSTLVANSVLSGQNVNTSGNVGEDVQTKYDAVKKAGSDFDADINSAAKTLLDALNVNGSAQFKDKAISLGWASAGALNSTLVRASSRAMEIVSSAAPHLSGPNISQLREATSSASSEYRLKLETAMKYLVSIAHDSDYRGQSTPSSVSMGADMEGRNVLAQLIKPVTDTMVRGLTDKVAYLDPVHPMGDIQNLGNLMLASGWTVFGIFLGLKTAAGAAAGQQVMSFLGSGAGPALIEGIAPIAWTLLATLFVCGTLHAYILPMLPFLLWFYAILAVVSVAAELIIAAPLAAFMHIRADGQELINAEQRTIWVMTFNALLRPSLLLLGLVCSNIVLGIGANFLNRTYGTAVTTTNGDSVVGIMGFISITILVFYMHYQLVVRSMQLITVVPQVVAQIIQAQDQERGEHREANQVFGAIGNFTSRGVTHASNAALSAMKPREKNDDTPTSGANPAVGAQSNARPGGGRE